MGLGTWAGLGAFKCSPSGLISGAGYEKMTLGQQHLSLMRGSTLEPSKKRVQIRKKKLIFFYDEKLF